MLAVIHLQIWYSGSDYLKKSLIQLYTSSGRVSWAILSLRVAWRTVSNAFEKSKSYDVHKVIGWQHVTHSVEQGDERRSCRASGPEGVLVSEWMWGVL